MNYVDNCMIRKPVIIKNTKIWNYFLLNKTALVSKEIKPFTVLDAGKFERIRRNHGFKYGYKFLIASDTVSQHYAEFDLLKKISFMDKQVKNIYYKHNISSPAWKIIPLFRRAIEDAEKQWHNQL